MIIGLVLLPAENENPYSKQENEFSMKVSGELNTVVFLMTMMFFIVSGISLL